jgi:hypothetical protein
LTSPGETRPAELADRYWVPANKRRNVASTIDMTSPNESPEMIDRITQLRPFA